MTRAVAVPLALVLGALAAVAGLVLVGHLGNSAGTPAAVPTTPPTYSCPLTVPDACLATVAEDFGVAAENVPTIGAIPAGLQYQRGRVVKAPNGRKVADFDFRDPRTGYVYNIGFVRMAPLAHDSARVATTPGGRKYRAVENQPLGLRYVVYEPLMAIAVQVIGAPTQGTSVPRTAEALLDAVHLKQQVDPRP